MLIHPFKETITNMHMLTKVQQLKTIKSHKQSENRNSNCRTGKKNYTQALLQCHNGGTCMPHSTFLTLILDCS
jgi:hypothetical protein